MSVIRQRRSELLNERRDVLPLRPWSRRLVLAGLWGLIGTAAVGGVVGIVRPSQSSVPLSAGTEAPVVPAPVIGFAELAVRAWITASPGSDLLLDALFSTGSEPAHNSADPIVVSDITAVAAQPVEERYWAVTVAARVVEQPDEQGSALWFLEVGVVEDDAGALAAVGTPALVPAPRVAVDPRRPVVLTLHRPDPGDPMAVTLNGFFSALLADGGDVSRYLAPGFDVAAVTPPPFLAVELSALATAPHAEGEARVRAEVRGTTTSADAWTVAYELVLVERDGRWEVRSLTGAPALGTPTSTAETATTSASPTVATTAASIGIEPGA